MATYNCRYYYYIYIYIYFLKPLKRQHAEKETERQRPSIHIYKSYLQSRTDKSKFQVNLQSGKNKKTTNYFIAMQYKTIITIHFYWKLTNLYDE